MGLIYQPCFYAFPDVDGPLYTLLDENYNVSAWIREAMGSFIKEWNEIPPHGEGRQFRTALRTVEDAELIAFFRRLPLRRQSLLMRSMVWYRYGQLSSGQELDIPRLAGAIVSELRGRGVQLGQAPPEQADDKERAIIEAALGDFLT